jgi:hypothetical protein
MDMELRVKKPALVLAMGVLVLALAGVGCGDDDGGASGTSGSGGTGGTSGTSGTGGTGGTGGTPTVEQCVTDTAAALPDTLPLTDACMNCICTADVAKTEACNGAAMCWPLVECSVVTCQGDPQCSLTSCTAFIGGLSQATALRTAIESCQSTCFPQDLDAGNTDAGN